MPYIFLQVNLFRKTLQKKIDVTDQLSEQFYEFFLLLNLTTRESSLDSKVWKHKTLEDILSYI